MTSHAPRHGADDERLRLAGALFVVAYLIHAGDHFRRGIFDLTGQVFWAGNFQGVLGLITVILVFTHHRWAPAFAIVVGFGSALGFIGAHFLPEWSAFSDSFIDGDVLWFSWFAAIVEIAADLFLGWAGLRCWQAQRGATSPPSALAGTRT